MTVIPLLVRCDVRFRWDKKKGQALAKERNIHFAAVGEVFDHFYHLSQKNDAPEQWRAIGWVGGKLITLIFEEREDEHGMYYWFITAWIATKSERRLFHEV